MKLENPIGWCDETTNAVTGCDKVSPGCTNCYAEAGTRARVLRAQGKETWGPKGVREPVNFEPVFRRLNKLCICDKCHVAMEYDLHDVACMQPDGEGNHCDGGKRRRVRLFADTNSDWLDPKWPVETLARFLDAIRLAPNVNVLLLTKRIELWHSRLDEAFQYAWDDEDRTGKAGINNNLSDWIADWIKQANSPPNIWLGVSCEDQRRADERIPLLLQTPAAVRFLSVEPLLESISLRHLLGFKNADGAEVDWVIVGGESGKNRRDCGGEAIVSVAEQCRSAGVPCYVKQDCARLPGQQYRIPDFIWNLKQFPP